MVFKSRIHAATMLAIDIAHPGGPEVLVSAAHPIPRPASGEILVKIAAAGINRPDVLQRRGLYRPPGAPPLFLDSKSRV